MLDHVLDINVPIFFYASSWVVPFGNSPPNGEEIVTPNRFFFFFFVVVAIIGYPHTTGETNPTQNTPQTPCTLKAGIQTYCSGEFAEACYHHTIPCGLNWCIIVFHEVYERTKASTNHTLPHRCYLCRCMKDGVVPIGPWEPHLSLLRLTILKRFTKQ